MSVVWDRELLCVMSVVCVRVLVSGGRVSVAGLKKMCLSAHNREVVSWGRTFVAVVSLPVLLSKNVTSVDRRSTEEKFTM